LPLGVGRHARRFLPTRTGEAWLVGVVLARASAGGDDMKKIVAGQPGIYIQDIRN
jgi:hypothetical protein